MTPQNGRRRVAGALAGGAVACALLAGVGAPAAPAAPASDQTSDTEQPPAPAMTGEEALAIVQRDYDLGSGGGQLSTLIHEVLVLRNLGFRPSNANKQAIVDALDKRPNQEPLIAALKATVAYQRKIQSQAMAQQQQKGSQQPGMSIGGAPANAGQPGLIVAGPGGSAG